jgi:uncharacterized protein (TIGR02246 family)
MGRALRIQTSLLRMGCVLVLVANAKSQALAQKAPQAPAPAAKTNDTEKAIRETARRFVEAFNRRDAKSVALLWTEDGNYIDETGQRTSGREAIQKKYAEFFAENGDATIEIGIDALGQVSADAAIEDGHSKLTHAAGDVPPTVGRYTVIHVKRNGKWSIASARDLPAETSPQNDALADLDWMIGTWHAERLGVEMTIDCRWLPNKSFVEAVHTKREGDKTTPTATQIIGIDPRNGRITSWMFNADRSFAHGIWSPHGSGWAIEFEGIGADGTPTSAVNILSRVNDALVWKSTNRSVAGRAVPDTEEVVLKRK